MAKHRKTVTMSDIAEKLRVSTVTVSKALSGQKGVSDAVREEILELARQMGYEAPASSKRKLEQKSFQIGVLISERYLGDITSFYWKMYQEISEYAMQKFCYTMFEGISESMEEEKRLPRLIEEQKVDAVMVVGRPGYHYDDFLRDHVKLPMVFLDFYPPDAKVYIGWLLRYLPADGLSVEEGASGYRLCRYVVCDGKYYGSLSGLCEGPAGAGDNPGSVLSD